mgnify:CR=1 FL=1
MTHSAIALGETVTPLFGDALQLGPRDEALRTDLIRAVGQLHSRGLLDFGGAANASIRLLDAPDHLLVTSRGLPRDITAEDFGLIRLDGTFVAGQLGKGIRQVIEMHTPPYKRARVGAVFHAHTAHATAFALAHRSIPAHFEPLIKRGQTVDIPVTRYGDRNNGEMVNQLDAVLQANPTTHAVLLANHGVLVFHEDAKKTAELLQLVDDAAALILRAQALGGSQVPLQ